MRTATVSARGIRPSVAVFLPSDFVSQTGTPTFQSDSRDSSTSSCASDDWTMPFLAVTPEEPSLRGTPKRCMSLEEHSDLELDLDRADSTIDLLTVGMAIKAVSGGGMRSKSCPHTPRSVAFRGFGITEELAMEIPVVLTRTPMTTITVRPAPKPLSVRLEPEAKALPVRKPNKFPRATQQYLMIQLRLAAAAAESGERAALRMTLLELCQDTVAARG